MSGSSAVEVLPPGKFPLSGNFHHSGNFDPAEAACRIAFLHQQARDSARLAIVFAARAGAELAVAKKALPHGAFGEFRGQCGLSHTTAGAYMALAEQLQDRLGKRVDLLALPDPRSTTAEEQAALLKRIEKVTDGKTLTQLYFDWDIKRDPKPTGGARRAAKLDLSPEELAKLEVETARSDWQEIGRSLQRSGIKDCSWQHLRPIEIEAVLSIFEEIQKLMHAHLRGVQRPALRRK